MVRRRPCRLSSYPQEHIRRLYVGWVALPVALVPGTVCHSFEPRRGRVLFLLVTLMSELCGLCSLALDWKAYRLGANVDATAAIGMVSRGGVGKTKPTDT
eukprot:7286756-Pyramimonas_sp.AAC.1